MEPQTADATKVTQVEMSQDEINDILGTPGSEVIMTHGEEPKQNIFSTKKHETSYLSDPPTKATPEPVIVDPAKPEDEPAAEPFSDNELNNITNPEEGDEPAATGRPKTDKNGLIDFTNKMIEQGLIMPFDEDKPIEKYSLADFEELFKANIDDRERKIKEQTPIEFFDSLPYEMQYAAKYIADGGTDLKGLFRTLAASEEIKALDPADEKNHKLIVRSYLQAKRFGTEEEIEDEIDGWEDRGELEAKALKFKPKLDEMQEQVIAAKLKEQENNRLRREKQSEIYMDNIYRTLEPGDLNGIKIDKKTQGFLFSGLVEPRYPSVSGRATNLLGHLLEKYQYVEPNHGLIAEVLWLLADPEGYKSKVKETGQKETTEKHVRMLKTEESRKISSATTTEEPVPSKQAANKLARPSGNFFKRSQ